MIISQSSDANYDTANPSYIRKYLRTYGLTPPRAESYETQKTRCLAQLGLKNTSIDKFQYLSTLRKNNVHLFYRLVTDHLRVRPESQFLNIVIIFHVIGSHVLDRKGIDIGN